MRKGFWVILLLIVVSSCFRPHYQRQYVDIPESWRIETDEASTLCNFRWWEQFNDPVLDELILTALYNNQDLQAAISRVFEFYARLGVTCSKFYPQVYGQYIYTRTKSSIAVPLIGSQSTDMIPSIQRINNDFLGFFNTTWELDFWGRIYSASAAAYADLLSEEEARRAVVLTVVTSVANAYIALRQLDEQLKISIDTLNSREESVKLAKSRFHLGETSELEVKQAEAELEIAAIRKLEFERAIPIQENLLSILVGENPQTIERGKTLDQFSYLIEIPAGLPSELLERRPDILEAEDKLVAANARVTEARALFFPQFTLTGMYGSDSDELRTFLTSPAAMWQYGISMVQTIFDAGKLVYNLDETIAFRNELLYNYRETILNAFREVNDALVENVMDEKIVKEHEIQVEVLGEYLHLATLRYEEGEVDYLNVLDAERSLFSAQLDLVTAQADRFSAIVQLYGALGGGWVYDADSIAMETRACCR